MASTHLSPPNEDDNVRRRSSREDKVSRWLRENEGQLERRADGSKERPGVASSPSKRGAGNLAADLCQALLDKEGASSSSPTAPAQVQATENGGGRKSDRKKRRRRSSLLENPGVAVGDSPRARTSFASSESTQKLQKNIRKSVAGVLNFLEEEEDKDEEGDVFYDPKEAKDADDGMEETACVGGIRRTRIGGGLVDFSSDSAKAIIAEYEARFRNRGDGENSQGSEDSAAKAAAAAGLVTTSDGAVVDFGSDSARALIAEYEARLGRSSGEGGADGGEVGDDGHADADADGENGEEEHLPATQPSLSVVLQGVTAYVEFRTGHENRSRCVEEVLESLGAVVAKKLTRDVTHMVFKDGSLATYNKGKKLGIHIVSNMWVEACKNEGTKVSEGLFPSTSKEK